MEITEINCDMDGVTADWRGYVLENHFIHHDHIDSINKHPYRELLLRGMYSKDPEMFYKLEMIKGASALLGFLLHLHRHHSDKWTVRFLSATPPEHPDPSQVRLDKKMWNNVNAGIGLTCPIPTVCVNNSPEKKAYAKPGSLLIDDFSSNIVEWRENGGTAIWVDTENTEPNYNLVVEQLKEIIDYDRRTGND